MLKFEGFKVGQRIRAFDFEPTPGRRNRYIEGTIEEVSTDSPTPRGPFHHYLVRVTYDTTRSNERSRVGRAVMVPMEIGGAGEEYAERITLITAVDVENDTLAAFAGIAETMQLLIGHALAGGTRAESFQAEFAGLYDRMEQIHGELDERLDALRDRIEAANVSNAMRGAV